MDMCYDGALVMPSSFAMMDEEEMMYLDGCASGWVSFKSVSAAYNSHCVAGSALHFGAVGLGVGYAAFSTILGAAKFNLLGALMGAAIGAAGGIVAGSIVWAWGTKFHDCANELLKKKGTSAWSKGCKVKWYNIGVDFYYSISY